MNSGSMYDDSGLIPAGVTPAFFCARYLQSSKYHRIDVPLGYFNANESGKIRKQIDDNAALTETLLAHNLYL